MKLEKILITRIFFAVMPVFIAATLFMMLQPHENIDVSGDDSAKTDDKPVIMQEQSNKLLLYINSMNEQELIAVLNIFKEKYPNVEIELHEFIDNVENKSIFYKYIETNKTEITIKKRT